MLADLRAQRTPPLAAKITEALLKSSASVIAMLLLFQRLIYRIVQQRLGIIAR